MNILGLDPSSRGRNGFVIWDSFRERIVFKELLDGEGVVARIRDSIAPFSETPMALIVCETIQHMGNVVGADVFETCFWIGEYRRVAKDCGIPVQFVNRTHIKIHHCGTNKAKDPNIRAAILERYGDWEYGKTGQGTKANPGRLYKVKEDMWSALAIAIYGADQQELKERQS